MPLEKHDNGDYTYTDSFHDTLTIDGAKTFAGAWNVYLEVDGESIEIKGDDIDAVIAAIRDVAAPKCTACGGSGKAK
jgi:hypothetical protein